MNEKEGKVEPFDHNEFSESVPRDSKVIRNKNKKTISVSNAFDGNLIPIKVIATYEQWLKFDVKFFKTNKIEFKELKPYINRASKQNIKALKNYCKKDNGDFSLHFFYYYIHPAKKKNPLCSPNPRGGNPHGKTPAEMFEARIIAKHLYVFLFYWFQRDASEIPLPVKDFFKINKITHKKQSTKISETVSAIVLEVLKRLFDLDVSKNFFRKYVANNSLFSVKRGLQFVNYLPVRFPLVNLQNL